MRLPAAIFVFLALVSGVTACQSDEDSYVPQVTHRAQLEFPCPVVTIEEIDHYTYLAVGCGCRGVYECGVSNGEGGSHGCLLAPPVRGDICETPDGGTGQASGG